MKIGIDLGGTKTEAILIQEDGKEVYRKRIKTQKNYEGTIEGIINLIKEIEETHGKADSIGVGMPGIVSNENLLVKNANSTWLNGKPLGKDLNNILNRKIKIENDANCFALSESVDGAGKNYDIVFGVIIGTGTGGGIVINNKIIQGRNQISGEWGHTILPNQNEEDKKYVKSWWSGFDGCIESYLSGPGFSHIFNQEHKTNFDSHQIIELFESGDKRALKALENYVDRLARGLSSVINILDPDVIVLGGGMSNIDYIYSNINSIIKKYVISDTFNTKIVKNLYGDSSGVRGAAWL